MPVADTRRVITDDLLAVAVRIKRDAGVSHTEIQTVIDRFACGQRFQERTGGIGFPLVEDIPHDNRAGFLALLSDLRAGSDSAPVWRTPNLSAAEIWPARVD